MHPRGQVLRQKKGGRDVHCKKGVPFYELDLLERLDQRHAGVVNQTIERLGPDRVDHLLHSDRPAEVIGQRNGLGRFLFDQAASPGEGLAVASVEKKSAVGAG